MALPGSDRLSYRGLSFDTLFSVKVTARPQANDSGRATKWVAHTLRASGWVVGDVEVPDTNTSLQSMRQQLSEPGGTLRFSGRGYSDLDINVPGGVKDVNFGPKPSVLEWTPRGDDRGAFVVWEVVTCIPEQASARTGGIIAYDYAVSYAINRDSLLTVTTTGYCEIGMTRPGADNHNLPDNVDIYRRVCAPPLIKGFSREQQWNVSQDKRRLEFTITDTQHPFPLVPGTTYIKATHRISSGMRQGFAIWPGSIDCMVRVPPHESKKEAFAKMLLICLNKMGGMPVVNGQVVVPAGPRKDVALITEISLVNEMFENTFGFTFAYQRMGTNLDELVGARGFFEPAHQEIADYQKWLDSHKVRTWDAYGSAGVGLSKEMDQILDPGVRGNPTTPKYNPKLDRSDKLDKKLPPPKQLIDPKASWLFMEATVNYEEEGRIVKQVAVGAAKVADVLTFGLGGKARDLLDKVVPGAKAALIALGNVNFSEVGDPDITLRVTGRAIRIGFKIPRPTVKSIGGIPVAPGGLKVQPKRSTFKQKPVALGISGLECWAARWELVFILPGRLPAEFAPNAANVVLGFDGNLD